MDVHALPFVQIWYSPLNFLPTQAGLLGRFNSVPQGQWGTGIPTDSVHFVLYEEEEGAF